MDVLSLKEMKRGQWMRSGLLGSWMKFMCLLQQLRCIFLKEFSNTLHQVPVDFLQSKKVVIKYYQICKIERIK